MKIWKVKNSVIKGKNYGAVIKQAYSLFHQIEKRTKRQPYVKSKYFKNQKVFISYFLDHIKQKNPRDRRRRLRYFACAIELIENSTHDPDLKYSLNKESSDLWFRFFGETDTKEIFVVQIKENKKKQKFFMSVFPYEGK